jgi:hypothetical protein
MTANNTRPTQGDNETPPHETRSISTATVDSPGGPNRRSETKPYERRGTATDANPVEQDETDAAGEPTACNHPAAKGQQRDAKGHFTADGARLIVAGNPPDRVDGDALKTIDTRRDEIRAHLGNAASVVELTVGELWAVTAAEMDAVAAYLKRVGPIGRGRVRRVTLHFDRLSKRLERLSKQVGLKARKPTGPSLEDYVKQMTNKEKP